MSSPGCVNCLAAPGTEHGLIVPTAPPPPPPTKIQRWAWTRRARQQQLFCGSCNGGHLGAPSLPGEPGAFPRWAGILIGLGLVGTAAVVAVTMLQARR